MRHNKPLAQTAYGAFFFYGRKVSILPLSWKAEEPGVKTTPIQHKTALRQSPFGFGAHPLITYDCNWKHLYANIRNFPTVWYAGISLIQAVGKQTYMGLVRSMFMSLFILYLGITYTSARKQCHVWQTAMYRKRRRNQETQINFTRRAV